MKKQLLIISILVVIVSIFLSCSVNSSSEAISTTAVTDSNGTTHYYVPVTDNKGNVSTTDKNQGVYAELETESNGKAVTKKDGTYVTNEHTTVLPINDETEKSSSNKKSTTKQSAKENQRQKNHRLIKRMMLMTLIMLLTLSRLKAQKKQSLPHQLLKKNRRQKILLKKKTSLLQIRTAGLLSGTKNTGAVKNDCSCNFLLSKDCKAQVDCSA